MTLRPASYGVFESPHCNVPHCLLPYRHDPKTGGWMPSCACPPDVAVEPATDDRAEWKDRFAFTAELLLRPPRDEHGRYIPEGAKLDVIQGWLDEHALGDPPAPERLDDGDTWMMVAFQLAVPQWLALERVLGAPPTDQTLSRLLQKLLNAHLVQQYALPE